MERPKDNLEQKALDDIERKIFEAYLDGLKNMYETAEPGLRGGVRHLLDDLILYPNNTIIRYGKAPVFDGSRAREIRQTVGITTTRLGEKLKFSQGTVSRYENRGIAGDDKNSLSAIERRYLLWLKEQGYNPFNI
ncbi:helix-turn-helix transcriptional regulator [Candidatus Woesearchaeota archaeon]|nr:helix-turn-helix transcriptional regulator [Candidatus Woesearchaeota archaeon]